MTRSIFIGFDHRWLDAFTVARESVRKHAPGIAVSGLVLPRLRAAGLYWRQTETRKTENGAVQLWDVISDAPMATEFSISRFAMPILAPDGWALFMDCDMLVRGDLAALFDEVERDHADKAIVCVKHAFAPLEGVKMDGQAQVQYSRKNWSSFFFAQVGHQANKALTVALLNEAPGRDLHAFNWLQDDALIGELPAKWNWLVGHSDPSIAVSNAHFTDGIPSIPGFEDVAYAKDWRETLHDYVQGPLSLPG